MERFAFGDELLPYDPVISFELESGMFPGTERIAVLPLFVATVHPGSHTQCRMVGRCPTRLQVTRIIGHEEGQSVFHGGEASANQLQTTTSFQKS